jgi:hypothetical protein
MPKANDLLETARMFDQRAEQAKRASIETEGQRLRVGSGEGAAGLRHRGGENPAVGIGGRLRRRHRRSADKARYFD